MLPLDKTTEGGQVKVICIKAKVISWKNKLIFGPQDLFFYFEIFLKMFWKALDLGYRIPEITQNDPKDLRMF